MQTLFTKAAPLSKERHGDKFLETGLGYDFAREMSFVPAIVPEFSDLVSDYVLAFLQKGDKVGVVALLGLQDKQNLYIKADGTWAVDYVPALLRQYPFAAMIGAGDDKTRRILCIAEDYPGLNDSGKGMALFDKDGEISEFATTAQKLVSGAAAGGLQTEAFVEKLKELELLTPIKAVLKNKAGEERTISGLHVVNREALNHLSGKTLQELQSNGMLEAMYLQLHSLRNLRDLAARAPSKKLAKAKRGKKIN